MRISPSYANLKIMFLLISKTIFLSSLLTIPYSLYPSVYYISIEGDDNANGTENTPWKSVEKANQALSPGDTVIFLPGEYYGCISPARSGMPSRPITYKAKEQGTSIICGGISGKGELHTDLSTIPSSGKISEFPGKSAITLYNTSYIVIAGFKLNVPYDCKWIEMYNANHNYISGLHLEQVHKDNPVLCISSNYNRFEDIDILRDKFTNVNTGLVCNDMWNNYNCSYNVYEKIYFSRAGHRPFGLWPDCKNNVIRSSIFDCRWGRNFELFSAENVLMEKCVITNGNKGSGSADGRAKIFALGLILRNNIVFRNHYGSLAADTYRYTPLPALPEFGLKHSRIYNNTFCYNSHYAIQLTDNLKNSIEDNVIKNNIMAFNDLTGSNVSVKISSNLSGKNAFQNNLIYGCSPSDKTICISRASSSNEYFSIDEINSMRPENFSENFAADPMFTNPEKDDYSISRQSPASEHGVCLTKVTESGMGTLLKVKDSRYFYDGFGIPGEHGDLIWIGEDKKSARIIRINHEDNILTLDRNIVCEANTPVYLPFGGNAPDIGAYKIDMDSENPLVPEGLRIRTLDSDSTESIYCSFEEHDAERWFYLWNYTRKPFSKVKIDDSSAAKGKRSLMIYATENTPVAGGSVLYAFIRPRDWNIDRFPYVKFSYRIPKEVPVGIQVSVYESERYSSESKRTFNIGGSLGYNPGKYRDLKKVILTSDDKWHEATIDVRLIREEGVNEKYLETFQFYTDKNGKLGDRFWIDEFQILPIKNEKEYKNIWNYLGL